MEIPLNVEIYCDNGLAGYTTAIVLDPETRNLTHIVVAEQKWPHRDHIVPIALIRRTRPQAINLACTRAGLANLPYFTQKGYIRTRVPDWRDLPSQSRTLPHQVRYIESVIPIKTENLPAGEAITTVAEKAIFLNLDKAVISKLPVIPTLNQRRSYHSSNRAYSYR